VLTANPKEVQRYRNGDEKVFGFLVGQVMKATRGKANPKVVNEILKKKLA
jgi:Asp-tRNA(Asn)/Glu-tRNA(Gln) amidotransferase B subunit